MALAELLIASAVYSAGGLFMKLSAGVSRPWPTVAFLGLFAAGAVLQALGMRDADLGASYIFVLGMEAVVTVLLSALFLREGFPPARIAAIVVVLAGIAWLRRT
jgi:multidrug transporter EmrE-like cation transporter